MATTITYGGNTIATLSSGETFTSSGLANKVTSTNIVVAASGASGEKTTVTYNGNTLFDQQSGTFTMPTAGKIVPHEFAVEYSGTPAASIAVTGLGNQTPSTVTFTESGTFDWNFTEVTDANNNIFVKIPTMYRKVNTVTDGQITSFTLSNAKIDNTYEPYPCFLDSNNNVLPYVLIGKYCCSSTSVANSVDASYASQTLATGRVNARALGKGYQLYDWQMQKLFVDLALCHKKNVDFHNSATDTTNYLGVYHLQNSVWVDGCYRRGAIWYAALNPDNYVSTPATHPPTGYAEIGYTLPSQSAYPVKVLGYDANNPFFNQPTQITYSTVWSAYYCDGFYNYSSGSCPLFSNVGLGGANFGLWFTNPSESWTSSLGVRLCYRPIS